VHGLDEPSLTRQIVGLDRCRKPLSRGQIFATLVQIAAPFGASTQEPQAAQLIPESVNDTGDDDDQRQENELGRE